MTHSIAHLADIADQFEAIVLDQWGVLHDGMRPYDGAIAALRSLHAKNVRLAVLSNSGKRSAPNAARIADMGFAEDLFETVMTSGEALYLDIEQGRLEHKYLFAITRDDGDAVRWAEGLDISLCDEVAAAEAVLLMGLPDGVASDAYESHLKEALARNIPVLCTNPDRASPRAGGATVMSPGALAHDHINAGGDVRFYGKPHLPVFRAVEAALSVAPDKLLMVGDSLEHDIAGAAAAGWSTVFVQGGLHGSAFDADRDVLEILADLAGRDAAPMPTFTLAQLE